MALGYRAARRAFVPERQEVTGDWRELHYERLHVVCWSPSDNSDRLGMWHVQRRRIKQCLVGKCDETTPLGRPCHRWEDNITMTLEWNERDSSCLRMGTSGRLL